MNEFIAFLDNLLGTYTPVTDVSGAIAPGMAGVDFPYVFRCLFFAIVVYCVFKIIGAIICRTY